MLQVHPVDKTVVYRRALPYLLNAECRAETHQVQFLQSWVLLSQLFKHPTFQSPDWTFQPQGH